LLVALLFWFFHFPEVKAETKSTRLSDFGRALRHKHLTWAVVAQFFYVGAQVCVTSFFIRMAKQGGGLDEKTAGYYLGAIRIAIYGRKICGYFSVAILQATAFAFCVRGDLFAIVPDRDNRKRRVCCVCIGRDSDFLCRLCSQQFFH
jgi:FHS family L-fucose permease-like MFS transporter